MAKKRDIRATINAIKSNPSYNKNYEEDPKRTRLNNLIDRIHNGELSYGIDDDFMKSYDEEARKIQDRLAAGDMEYDYKTARQKINAKSSMLSAYMRGNKSNMSEDAYNGLDDYIKAYSKLSNEGVKVQNDYESAKDSVVSRDSLRDQIKLKRAELRNMLASDVSVDNTTMELMDLQSRYDKERQNIVDFRNKYSAPAEKKAFNRAEVEAKISELDRKAQEIMGDYSYDDALASAMAKPFIDEIKSLQNQVNLYDRTNAVIDKYAKVREQENFEEDATYRPDLADDKLGMYHNPDSEAAKQKVGLDPNDPTTVYDMVTGEAKSKYWDQLLPEEEEIYYALFKNEGQEAAYRFLDEMEVELGRRYQEEQLDTLNEEIGTDSLKAIMHNVASIPANVYGGIMGFTEDALRTITGNDINPYSSAHSIQNYGQNVRGTTSSLIDKATDTEDALFSWGDFYQALMSGADSILGGSTLGTKYTYLMGMSAASSEARKLYEQGASNEQIFMGALLSGTAESFFEEFSLDHFVKMLDNPATGVDVLRNFLRQGGVEASEEIATEIANTITNYFVMGGASDYEQNVQKFMEDGYSEDEAKRLARHEVYKNIAKAGLGGFVSGGAMAGGASAINAVQYGSNYYLNQGIDALQNDGYNNLLDQADEIINKGGTNALEIKRLANIVRDTGGNFTSAKDVRKVGKLSNAVLQSQMMDTPRGIDDIKSRVKESFGGKQERDAKAKQNAAMRRAELYGIGQGNIDEQIDNAMAEILKNDAEQKYSKENGNEIVKATGSKGKYLLLETADGKTISSKDAIYKDSRQAALYETAARQGWDAEITNNVADMIRNTDDPTTLLLGISEEIRYGVIGAQGEGVFSKVLSPKQKQYAYSLGRQLAERQLAERQASVTQSRLDVKAAFGENAKNLGKVSFTNSVNLKRLSGRQKVSLSAIGRIANITNTEFIFYESRNQIAQETIPGITTIGDLAPNGAYANGKIYIDINAGNLGEGTILFTAAHELTHHIKSTSPAKFKILADFLMSEFGKQGTDIDSLIEDQIRKSGGKLSYDAAYEEVVADSMQRLFVDTNMVEKLEKLKNTDRTLWEKIRDFIQDLYQRIMRVYKGLDPSSQEAQEVKKMGDKIEKLADLFAEALVDAGDTYARITEMSDSEAFKDSEAAVMNQIRTPYTEGTNAWKEFVDGLNPEAKKVHDLFYNFYTLSKLTNVKNRNGKTVKKLNISSVFMTAQDWNDQIAKDQKWGDCAKKLAGSLPEKIRKKMNMNLDGSLTPTSLETEFKMAKSLAQRLVDSLGYETIENVYDLDGHKVTLATAGAVQSVGGEAYRRAVIAETRKLYKNGELRQVNMDRMSKDLWGSLGFLAVNTKTGASGDFTTICPQMMFNRGCFYCYRRAALTTGVNNKLVAESVWYTGEILRIKDSDIQKLNEMGGLRIQSFGDWMPHFSAQLADVLYDAELRGLQVKIITKEPSMIEYIAGLRKQGIGKNLYFNLSADYVIEKAPEKFNANTDNKSLDTINSDRPYMRDEDGTVWWKRALSVEEANEYHKKYPWVNVRIVATTQEEFIRGLKDPRVQVVTGYHGNIREWERIDSTTGKKPEKLLVEPLGDAGMPRFIEKDGEWSIDPEYPGKKKQQKELAQKILDEGLAEEYYKKVCCVFGRCADCKGKCGKYADTFYAKNATNDDAESVAYWAEHMTSAQIRANKKAGREVWALVDYTEDSNPMLDWYHETYGDPKVTEETKFSAREIEEQLSMNFDLTSEMAKQSAQAISDLGSVKVSKTTIKDRTRTLAVRFREDLINKGNVNLVGQVAKSSDDLAVIAQVFRDPRFETLRYIFTDENGKIVLQSALTSGVVDASSIAPKNGNTYLAKIFSNAKKLGAEKMYLLHNHPSGDPTPSSADHSSLRKLSLLAGHYGVENVEGVIIDSNKYSIFGESTHEIRPLAGTTDELLSGEGNKDLLGRIESPNDLATLAKKIQLSDGYSAVIFLGSKLDVQAVQEIENDLLSDEVELTEYIENNMNNFGAVRVAFVTPKQKAYLNALNMYKIGLAVDVIKPAGDLHMSAAESNTQQLSKGRIQGYAEEVKYSTRDSNGRVLTPAQQRYFKDSKVRDADGNLKVVYHGTDRVFTEFDNRGGSVGIFFTDDLDVANGYAGLLGAGEEGVFNPSRPMTRDEIENAYDYYGYSVEFDGDKITVDNGEDHFTFNNEKEAREHLIDNMLGYDFDVPSTYGVYLNLVNPLIIDADGSAFNSIEYNSMTKNTDGWVDFARENGYDGVIFNDVLDGVDYSNVYVALDPNQIKDTYNENPTENPDIRFSTREAAPNVERTKEAKKNFGTTTDFREAGYLLRDGSMLDFSGKRDGGPAHVRYMDHREIAEVFDEDFDTQTEYLDAFLNEGNIRLMETSPGMSLGELEPTPAQYSMIKKYIEHCQQYGGYFMFDIADVNGRTIASRDYSDKDSASKIISDIREFYKNGELPYRSDLNQFRYSTRTLPDGTKYVKLDGRLMYDANGNRLSPSAAYSNLIGLKLTMDDGDVIEFVKKIGNKKMYNELLKRRPHYDGNIDISKVVDEINNSYVEVFSESIIKDSGVPDVLGKHSDIGIESFDTRTVYIADDENAYTLELSIANLEDGTKVGYAKKHIDENPELWEKIKKEADKEVLHTSESTSTDNLPQSDGKVNGSEFEDNTTGEKVSFSIRQEAPPKKTLKGYKVFYVKDGKLYPPMVANPNGAETPVGVWLNADIGVQAPDSKTGRKQVKAGGKGTQGGSGSLAFRPGWHLGEIPLATQFDRLNPETGVKELFPKDFVWAECDIAADIDYQDEAMSYGYTKSGKFQHSLAGLPKLPKDGYYRYRTNPNPETVPWLITGAMKVNRLLSDEEVNSILVEKGIAPKMRQGGNKTLAELGLEQVTGSARFSVRDPEAMRQLQKVNAHLEKENAQLKEDFKDVKELLDLQGKVTGGRLLKRSSVEALARRFIKGFDVKGDYKELADILMDAYGYIQREDNPSWETVEAKLGRAVDWISSHKNESVELSKEAKSILKMIRESKVSLSDKMKSNAAHQYGSYGNYRKAMMGSISISDNAPQSLDQLWQELAETHPEYFDPDVSEGDMPILLADAISNIRNSGSDEFYYGQSMMTDREIFDELYNGFWDAATLYTVADKKQSEINALKRKHQERMATLRSEKNERIAELKKESSEIRKGLKKEYRERLLDEQKKLQEQYWERVEKARDKRSATELRHRITKKVNELNKLLLHPDSKHHVPKDMQASVAAALDMLDFENPRQGEKTRERLAYLKKMYDEFKKTKNPDLQYAYDELIAEMIDNVAEDIGDTPFLKMSVTQLEEVYQMYSAVLATIRNANKTFKWMKQQDIIELSEDVMKEVKEVGGSKEMSAKKLESIKKFAWNDAKPVYAMRMIGSDTLMKLFNNVRKGEDTFAKDISEAKAYFITNAEKYGYRDWDLDERYEFKTPDGKTFTLNLMEMMSLYEYNKRPQADAHLSQGGFVFEDNTIKKKNKLGIKTEYKLNTADTHRVTPMMMAEISKKLTPEQKAFADAMQKYLADNMGAKGNEVTEALYDIDIYNDEHYFPLKSSKLYMQQKTEAAGDVKVKNAGFTKAVVPFANNPIVLRGLMDVWADHVNDMSMYHAFVLPLEDFQRVYNYRTSSSGDGPVEGVKAFIRNAYGDAANNYIQQMLVDLNGGARADSRAGTLNQLIGLFKKGAVFASASVVIQQPSAIARAFAYIDPKYFVQSSLETMNLKQHSAQWEEVKKYAPVAIIKEMGFFDTGLGASTQDWITQTTPEGFSEKAKSFFTDSNYRDDVLAKAPELADEITWTHIWNAAKKQVLAENPGLEEGSEEHLEKAGELFTETIVNTQVYDSVLSRSALMRAKDSGTKMVTSFLAEPTTSLNMLADAIVQGKRTGNTKQSARVIGSVIAQILLNSILVSLVYAARDDDEDKTYVEKYVGQLVSNTLESANPLNMIPLVKDLVSLAKGYDVERPDMAIFSEVIKAWQKLKSSSVTPYRKVEEFAGSVAKLFGLPVKNVMRDIRGIMNIVNGMMSDNTTSLEGIRESIVYEVTGKKPSTQYKNKLTKAIKQGDTAKIKSAVDDWVKQKVKTGKTEKEAKSAIQSTLTSTYKPLFLQAYQKGDQAEMARIRKALAATGIYKDVVKTTQEWIKSLKDN